MIAVVQVGTHQYKISEGDAIKTQRLDGKKGDKVNLEQVLLYSDGTKTQIGRPFLKDVSINAEIVGQVLGPKLVSYKYRRRKTSDWKKGHRQQLTALKIGKINAK